MIRCLLILVMLVNLTYSPAGGGAHDLSGQLPLVFPTAMPPAARMISDVISEEVAWRAGIAAFLNNSTNLTNNTKLIIA